MSVIVPIGVQLLMSSELGSEKLESIILKCLNNEKEETLNRILLTFLYIDLSLPQYITKIQDLLKLVSNHKYSIEIIYRKLQIFLMMKKRSPEEVQKLAEMSAEMYVRLRGTGNIKKDKIIKGSMINKMKADNLKR